jgi:hypothetical protein
MSPQAGFLLQTQVLPRLKSAIPLAVSFIGSEDAEELVQDGTLIAAQMIHNAEQAGKKVVRNPGTGRRGARTVKTMSAGNVAFYTIQKLKCGRRSTGSSTVDVYGSGTQINGTTRLTSLDEAGPVVGLDDVGEPLVLHDVLSNDAEDPATRSARKLDWQHGLIRGRDQHTAALKGGFLVARGEADVPDIDGRVYIRGELPLGEFAGVKVIGHTDYDLIAEPA